MGIGTGEIIYIHHYSAVKGIKSSVDETNNNDVIVVSPRFNNSSICFNEGDPVTFKYDRDNKVILYDCSISEIVNNAERLKLLYEQIDYDINNRESRRYPVSLYAFIRNKENSMNGISIIKNISTQGMLAYSNEDLSLGEEYRFDLHFDNEVVFLTCIIARKHKNLNYFEYGLYISFNNSKIRNVVKKYVEYLWK